MTRHSLKYLFLLVVGILLFSMLTACDSSSSNNSSNSSNTSAPTVITQGITNATGVASTPIVSSPVVSTPVPGNSTPGTGPIVITSPTVGSDGQLVTLADRTLVIQHVSKQAGANADSTAVSLALLMKNTGSAAIQNKPEYFQLMGTEGDVFGLPAGTTSNFFGAITAHGTHSGTLVFQVPTGAVNGIRLFYRSEVAGETVLVNLSL